MTDEDGQKIAKAYGEILDSISNYLIRLGELLILVAAFDVASKALNSTAIFIFSQSLKFILGLHFATIYKPLFIIIDTIKPNLDRKLRIFVIAIVSVSLAHILLITSIELVYAARVISDVSGAAR